ncbi:hypothetical protein DFH94DRAFT_201147 [Russula ochroleuca]|jgi:hypothetical protein|uniref:Uncharacterized protein n=1 Tax=Russula ochroleuca TaxID=152965 RepID=A0A9P5JYW2_9AGAM|nr:hypothetical protein DFH94DRAFT_201147 [Russula ochroleuca]
MVVWLWFITVPGSGDHYLCQSMPGVYAQCFVPLFLICTTLVIDSPSVNFGLIRSALLLGTTIFGLGTDVSRVGLFRPHLYHTYGVTNAIPSPFCLSETLLISASQR